MFEPHRNLDRAGPGAGPGLLRKPSARNRRFADGARRILQDKGIVFVEASGPARCWEPQWRSAADASVGIASMVRHAKSATDDVQQLARGRWLSGASVRRPTGSATIRSTRSKFASPEYPFQQRRFPIGRGDVYSLLDDAALLPRKRRRRSGSGARLADGAAAAAESSLCGPAWCSGRNRKLSGALAQVSGLRVVNVRAADTFGRKRRTDYRMDLDRVSDDRRRSGALERRRRAGAHRVDRRGRCGRARRPPSWRTACCDWRSPSG